MKFFVHRLPARKEADRSVIVLIDLFKLIRRRQTLNIQYSFVNSHFYHLSGGKSHSSASISDNGIASADSHNTAQ
jgi:hypothetical protein